MLTRPGPGSYGYNALPEYMDVDCVVTLAAGASCVRGQVLCRNVTQLPSSAGADPVILPNATGAGPVYGVYQGPTFTNTTTAAQTYPIIVRAWGQGVVNADGTTAAVTVGGALEVLTTSANAQATADSPVPGTYVGYALATGAITGVGATLIASGGPASVVNCAIDCV
jgi:hypothetical protein